MIMTYTKVGIFILLAEQGKHLILDGGHDKNARFPETLVVEIRKFRKYNLNTLFVLTRAPGQSAYNVVE
jgi:hypothetical protein